MQQIRSVRLRNFRVHEDSLVEFDRVTNLVGHGGAGKSSVVAGIMLALLGVNEFTDERGAGMDTQIRDGARKASIVLTLTDGTTLERTIPGKAVNTEAVLGISPRTARAVMDARYLLDKPATEQERILLEILGREPADEELVRDLNAWSPEYPHLGNEFQKFIPEARGAKSLHDYAYQRRRASRQVRDDYEHQASAWEQALPPVTKVSGDAAKLKTERDTLIERIAEKRGRAASEGEAYASRLAAYNTARDARERATLDVEQAEARAKEAEKTVRAFEDSVPSFPTQDSLERALADAEAEFEENRKKRDALQATMATLPAGPCPPGQCLKQTNEEIAHLNERYARIMETVRGLNDQILRLKASHEKGKAIVSEMEAANIAWGEARKRLTSLPKPGPEPKKPSVEGHGTPDLEVRLEKVETALRAIEKEQEAAQERERLLQRIHDTKELQAKASADAEFWEAVEAALNPKGLPLRRVEKTLQDFEHDVNLILEDLYLEKCFGIETTPWCLMYGNYPARQMSTSERAVLSLAVQVVLARLTDFPVVVVDKHDASAIMRWDLLAFCEAQADLQFIILSSAQQTENGEYVRPEPVDGIAFYWLEAGTVQACQPALV